SARPCHAERQRVGEAVKSSPRHEAEAGAPRIEDEPPPNIPVAVLLGAPERFQVGCGTCRPAFAGDVIPTTKAWQAPAADAPGRCFTGSLPEARFLVTPIRLVTPVHETSPSLREETMILHVGRLAVWLVLVSIITADGASGQTTYPNVKFTGRLQQQFYYFDNQDYAVDVGPQSNVFTRRARIDARAEISERVAVVLQPSFEGGRESGVRLRDAYIDVRFSPPESRSALYLRAGQEKRPFSRYELTSSINLPSIERGAGRGLPFPASNDLFGDAGFLAHDVGASVRYEYELDDDRRLTLKVGAYNGQGESLDDVNNRKSFGARGTLGVTSGLDIGASWFAHDGIVDVGGTPDSAFTNHGFGIDASWGKPGDEGLYALAEYLSGEDGTVSDFTMQGIQALAAYHIRLTNDSGWLYAVEPAFRLDLADPNTDAENDRVTTLTAVLGLYLSSRAQLRVAYERQSSQDEASPSISGVRSALTVNF
ncbi:MAG TPA: porin, partial [Gemmatimonadales bacterium]|nr:porin [Gemmatimonadales bacterium]